MPTPQQEVLTWLHTQKDWLQEAASKILTQNEISNTDIDDLIVLLKSTAGQAVTATRTFPSLSATVTPTTLRLDAISEVKGIDSLAPRNPLAFGTDNITVIYGNNGSGKSGYTRILKRATGKANAKELKPNVYVSPEPTNRSCKIKYTLEGTATEIVWNARDVAINDLLGVDIFDTDNATMYLTKEKDVSYTPPLVSLFEEIVNVCKRISTKLETEKNTLVKQLPPLPTQYTTTTKSKLYNGLRSTHEESALSDILIFSDEEKKAIEDLEARLKADDPKAKAIQLRKSKAHLDKFVATIKLAYDKTSQDSCNTLFTLKNNALTKRQVAIESNKEKGDLFKLDGVGSETWKALWEAARKYSMEEVYKGVSFPKIEDAKCVLCHQDLDENTQKRMQGFDEFVKSTLETEAAYAEKVCQDKISDLPLRPNAESIKNTIELCGLDYEEWETKLETIWIELETKISKLKFIDGSKELIGTTISSEIAVLERVSKGYESLAIQYDEDAKKFDRVKAQVDLLELKTLSWTSEQKNAILSEVIRLQKYKILVNLLLLTKTKPISTKASQLSESIITVEYVRRFNAELAKLGAKNIKVKLVKTRAQDGVVKHQIKLKDAVTSTSLVDVLSEGEQRIISLAAFLADVTGRNESTPFVFDDPISSLDQDFEEKTINRLIQLSNDRQVIIFTHRLSFMSIINTKAISINPILIYKETWGSGEVGDLPFLGITVKKSLNILKDQRLLEASRVYDAEGLAKYNILAKTICTDFRIVIEKLIETDFLSGVVERFRREVQTKNKIGNLAKIEVSDCTLIEGYMTKYSTYEHSHSPETPVDLPLPDELEEDFKVIITWHKEFKKRMTNE